MELYPPRTFEKGLYLHHIDGVLSIIWRDGVVGVSIHGQLEDDFTPLSINPATLAHVWAAAWEKKTHKTYYTNPLKPIMTKFRDSSLIKKW
jgi:hypothetical protein